MEQPGHGQQPRAARRGDRPLTFVRQRYVFQGRLGTPEHPAEPGRYHLYVSSACPWAQRAMIVRRLEGLEGAVGATVLDPVRDERGWAFRLEPDPVNGFRYLREAYLATDPGYDLQPTVPVLWDRTTGRIVSNFFDHIDADLATAFGGGSLYPPAERAEVDALNAVVYPEVNDGVYRCGFARSQEAYDRAFDALFARLDSLDALLASRRFLTGDAITLADVRLFTTLVRFDAVYHLHFKCNLRRLVDYPNLWPYARDLWQRRGFADTTDFDHIKRHYYLTHPGLDPTGIVPRGPESGWDVPHGRDRLP